MSTRKKKVEAEEAVETLEAEPEVAEETAEEPAEEAAAEPAEAETEETEPVVYIGPDIRYVANHGTIYSNGLPAALEKKIEEIPAIRGLIIPVSKLASAYKAVGRHGTALNNLYEAVRERLTKRK